MFYELGKFIVYGGLYLALFAIIYMVYLMIKDPKDWFN